MVVTRWYNGAETLNKLSSGNVRGRSTWMRLMDHSRPTASDCGKASAAWARWRYMRYSVGFIFKALPMASGHTRRRRLQVGKGGMPNKQYQSAVVSTTALLLCCCCCGPTH